MNSPPLSHPNAEQLREFCLGRLDEQQMKLVHAHLEGCVACAELAGKVKEDTFLQKLREEARPAGRSTREAESAFSTQASAGGLGTAGVGETAVWNLSSSSTGLTGAPAIPGLEVLQLLGRGGMGVVYLVRQTQLKRLAALKMIRKGDAAGMQDLARFRTEAETFAKLQHDNIVQIYQVGTHEESPYLLLEYVDGGTLAQKIVASPLPSRQAAAITRTLAQAVQFAHEKGVIHRDLKPSNILLNQYGKPKISDFGLAKQADTQNVLQDLTMTRAVLGTPSYMAPEQAAGHSRDITPRADIYALGAILYEMVVGRPPFKGESPLVTVRQVLFQDPVPPRRLQPDVPADLEAIILKCLEKSPEKRYESAAALAEDLRRFLANETVQARPARWWLRSARWVKRRPALAGLIGVSLVALLFLMFALSSWFYSGRLETALGEVETQKAVAEREREHAQKQKARASYMAGLLAAEQSRELGTASFIFDFLEQTTPRAGEQDFRGFEWYHLWRLCHRDRETLRSHRTPVTSVALSSDDAILATASRDGTIKLWDFTNRREKHSLAGHAKVVRYVAFSPKGTTLASAGLDGSVKLWNVEDGKELADLPGHEEGASTCVFDPNGKWLVTGSMTGVLRVWTLDDLKASPRILARLPFQITCAAVSPDGTHLAASGGDRFIQRWEMPSGKEINPLKGHRNPVHALAYSPRGETLASGSEDGEVLIWDPSREESIKKFLLHHGPVSSLAFNPRGDILISGSLDHSVRIWRSNKAGWGYDSVALGHTGMVSGACLSSDGQFLVTGSYDQTVKVWDLDPIQEPRRLKGHNGEVRSIMFNSHGEMYSLGADNRLTIRIGDEDTLRHVKTSGLSSSLAMVQRDNVFYLGGTTEALIDAPGHIHTLELVEGNRWKETPYGGQGGWVTCLTLNREGKLLASGGLDRSVKLWDLTSREVATLVGHTDQVHAVAFSPDGKTLASGGPGDQVILWDVDGRKERTRLKDFEGVVTCLVFSPDGKYLVIGGENRTTHQCPLVVWDVELERMHALLKGHTGKVNALAFSPDGKQLATGAHDQTVKLWDWETREERATYRHHLSPVKALAFSHDGRTLVSGDQDGNLIVRRGARDAEVKGERR